MNLLDISQTGDLDTSTFNNILSPVVVVNIIKDPVSD